MSLQLRSLIWKECRERKWSLVLGITWVLLGIVCEVGYEGSHRVHAPVAVFHITCMLYGLFAAVFLAMGTALREVTQGTLGFSRALPVSLRQIAYVRLGGAVVTLGGPMVLGAVVLSLFLLTGFVEQGPVVIFEGGGYVPLPNRPSLRGLASSGLVWIVTVITVASSVELLLILALLGARWRAESHVGFLGVCVSFVWILLQSLPRGVRSDYVGWWGVILPQTLVRQLSYRTVDGRSSYGELWLVPSFWLPLAVNLLVLATLAAWFARRYGTRPVTPVVENPAQPRWQFLSLLAWAPLRRPGSLASLISLDLRQAVPMCLAGLVLAVLMATVEVLESSKIDPTLPFQIANRLSSGTFIVGVLWSAVVGAGIFASEFEPKLEQFWRSRPISPSAWFWIKFCVGLAAVLGVLDLVAILVGLQSFRQLSFAYIACVPLLHALVYALAVVTICWLRRPVLAGTAALLGLYFIHLAFEFVPGGANYAPIEVFNLVDHDGAADLTLYGYPAVYGGIAASIVLLSLAAWLGALRPVPFQRRAPV